MKTIIAIWGNGEIGKTAVIRAIFKKLDALGHFENLLEGSRDDDEDFSVIGDYNSKKIGIESQGDPKSRQGISLKKLAGEQCEIIICACRIRGTTVTNIENIAQSDGYEIIWTSNFSSLSAMTKKGIMPNGVDLNDEFATAVINLIDKLQ
ncbi:hypothetical protein FACS1894195_1750 [Bacteroidia bacterium]|nr:hypothetical protein FACS1894195_1750 [Bacteroidia bacterium]